MTRQKSALYNLLSAFVLNIVTVLLGFVTQRLFIMELGTDAAGLHSLFSTITNIFVMADMGVGAAVIFHMYKPFAKKQYNAIVTLVNFYRKVCFGVSGFIIVGGVMLLPFLGMMTNNSQVGVNIYALFSLYIVNSVFAYLMTYKRAILQADQKNYVISTVHVGYVLLLNSMQIALLLTTRNYYLFMAVMIVMRIVENILLNLYIDRKYTFLRKRIKKGLSQSTKKGIIKLVKGSLFHNSAGHLVSSVDNVVISSMLGLTVLGLYSNYQMIFMAAGILISQVFYSITANIGNLLIEHNLEKSFSMVKRLRLLNLAFGIVATSVLWMVTKPFITLWLGEGFLLGDVVLLVLVANFFLQTMRAGMITMQSAAGILYENRFIPIYETIINLVLSVALAAVFGLPGVIVATIVSVLFLHLVAYPKYVFEVILQRKRIEYIYAIAKDSIMAAVVLIIEYGVMKLCAGVDNMIAYGAICLAASLIIPGILLYIFYGKSDEFGYFRDFAVEKWGMLKGRQRVKP